MFARTWTRRTAPLRAINVARVIESKGLCRRITRNVARPAKALPLALCGADDVQQDGVLALGRVSDEVLGALYAHADLFVFLSLIEGFGYPPIEALRAGTPVVCSTLDASCRAVSIPSAKLRTIRAPPRSPPFSIRSLASAARSFSVESLANCL